MIVDGHWSLDWLVDPLAFFTVCIHYSPGGMSPCFIVCLLPSFPGMYPGVEN